MAGVEEMPIAIKKKRLSAIKGSEEKRFMIEDAARTMKRFAEIKREIREIKADKELLEAARTVLRQEITDTKKAMTS
ncbi:hypothetical protein LCGC14_0400360 [marine sediment metagenome]|uniref:Uncharacterized protein n=1 Tax=marine sediment metagenome TaxID=412755 RepID=A0A0F9VIW4_9ZZZZ